MRRIWSSWGKGRTRGLQRRLCYSRGRWKKRRDCSRSMGLKKSGLAQNFDYSSNFTHKLTCSWYRYRHVKPAHYGCPGGRHVGLKLYTDPTVYMFCTYSSRVCCFAKSYRVSTLRCQSPVYHVTRIRVKRKLYRLMLLIFPEPFVEFQCFKAVQLRSLQWVAR